ncbi:type II secretion system protein GspL [Franconibacter pulveris]|uniref:type II secretion system protein GspL n=1 Tax=Franconibacter pulveris TaxID=435910 RepID=UPI0004963BDD|nr:type II secretion system protein GspL [Franconibacter pulveris]
MKNALIIRAGSNPEQAVWWWPLGAADEPAKLAGWAQLSELASHPLANAVCLLIPASEVAFRDFTLTKKGPFAQLPQFSWLAEESLMGDVEDLHWTVVRKVGNEVTAAAINATLFQQMLDACHDAGLQVVKAVPDALLLPFNPDGATFASLEDEWWIRPGEAQATVVSDTLLPAVMARLGEGNHQCYGEMIPAWREAVEPQPWQHPLRLIVPELRARKFTLLHGAFSQQADIKEEVRRWRKPLIGAVVLALLLSLLPQLANLWQIKTQQKAAEASVQALFKAYFPQSSFTSNLKYHFTQQLKTPQRDFFQHIAQLDQLKSAFNDIELGMVRYDAAQSAFTLNVTAPGKARVEAFVNQAKPAFAFAITEEKNAAAGKPFSAVLKGEAVKK